MVQRFPLRPSTKHFLPRRRKSSPHTNRRSGTCRWRWHLRAPLGESSRYASSAFSSASKQPIQPLLWSARASALVKPSCVRNTSVKVPRGRNSTVTNVSSCSLIFCPEGENFYHAHVNTSLSGGRISRNVTRCL